MKLHMSFPHLEISLVFKIYIKFHLLSDASTLGGSPVTTANLSVNEDKVNLSMTSSNSAAMSSQKSFKQSEIAQSIGTPEDRSAYRGYRIRKTTSLLKDCIDKKLGFKQKYVELSRKFYHDIDNMPLHEIEQLNMKCSQKLNNEDSYSDSEDESDTKQTLKRKQSVPLQRPSRSQRPSQTRQPVQNYLSGFRTSAALPQTSTGAWQYSYHDPYNLPPICPTSELNQVTQSFGTCFKFNTQDNQSSHFFTSTPTPQTETYVQQSVQASPSFQSSQYAHNITHQSPTNLTTPKNLNQPQFSSITPSSTPQQNQQKVNELLPHFKTQYTCTIFHNLDNYTYNCILFCKLALSFNLGKRTTW